MARSPQSGRFTGWHATGILVVFFGVIVGVNVTMAMMARSSFGGVVVENSYVASQEFNGWLAQAESSERLGWIPHVTRQADGLIAVELQGAPAGTHLAGEARHPLGRMKDLHLDFSAREDGSFISHASLPEGRWTLRLEARHDETLWRAEEHLQ